MIKALTNAPAFDRIRGLRERFGASTERGADSERGFEIRHFAGPLRYTDQLDRLRVAHLTDLHVGTVTPMAVQKQAIAITNRNKPDIITITGDFVCHSQTYLDQLSEIIDGFEAPVFCVMGNHDYWAGAREVRRALRRGGAEILDNAHTTITIRHQEIQVLGLDDAYTDHASWEAATKGLRSSAPVIGLSHIAEEADALWEQGVPLVLSGHTHGGQVTLAKIHELSVGKVAGHKYVHGLYGDRSQPAPKGSVYVGAGVGAAVMPIRIGERGRREVAFFELGLKPGEIDEHHRSQIPLAGRKPSSRTQERRARAVVRKQTRRDRKTKKT